MNSSVETNPANFGRHTMIVPSGSIQTFSYTATNIWFSSTYIFTLTGPTSTVFQNAAHMPRANDFTPCCGVCKLPYLEVDVRYWPAATSNTGCLASIIPETWKLADRLSDDRQAANTGNIPLEYHPLTARAIASEIPGNHSLLVGPDGYT